MASTPAPAQDPYHYKPVVEEHDQSLYAYDAIAPRVPTLADIGEAEVEQYRELGFVAVERGVSMPQVADAKAALSDLINERLEKRAHLMFEAAAQGKAQTMTPQERELTIRKVANFKGHDPRLDAILLMPELLEALERLGCAEPTVFQTMALLKAPGGSEKPWHQDHAYFNTPLEDRIVGVWIALDEATPENGCMTLIPGRMEPRLHAQRRDWQICDSDIQALEGQRVACPLKPGGMLLFDSLLPHGTPINRSDKRRQALQYHYVPASHGTITHEERMAIFGIEGKDVTC